MVKDFYLGSEESAYEFFYKDDQSVTSSVNDNRYIDQIPSSGTPFLTEAFCANSIYTGIIYFQNILSKSSDKDKISKCMYLHPFLEQRYFWANQKTEHCSKYHCPKIALFEVNFYSLDISGLCLMKLSRKTQARASTIVIPHPR